MNKKIKIAITAAFLAVVMLAMTVSVAAVDHWYDYAYPASGTVKYTGLLRTLRNSNKTAFILAGGTCRFDDSGTGGQWGPGYTVLDLKVRVSVIRDRSTYHYREGEDTNVAIGGYLSIGNQAYNESIGIDEVKGEFYYKTVKSTSWIKLVTIEKCVHDEPEE